MSITSVSAVKGASPEIVSAIKQASVKTGVDFSYLVDQARAESGFRADVKAKTSSATGLYQFINATWLATVKEHGAKHGYGDFADKIQKDFNGRYFVANDADKKAVLDLRKDVKAASLMAAEFAASNQNYLEGRLGRDVNSTDLYFAHFLGAGGAAQFLGAMDKNPHQSAAAINPQAAKANYNVFYDKNGKARSLEQVYAFFDKKFTNSGTLQTAKANVEAETSRGYKVDPMFYSMYKTPVIDVVERLPAAMPIAPNSSFFSYLNGLSDDMAGLQQINPYQLMMMAQLDTPR